MSGIDLLVQSFDMSLIHAVKTRSENALPTNIQRVFEWLVQNCDDADDIDLKAQPNSYTQDVIK